MLNGETLFASSSIVNGEESVRNDSSPILGLQVNTSSPTAVSTSGMGLTIEATPIIQVAVPSMKGDFTVEGPNHICKGVWALSDAFHEIPGETSQFEFKLKEPFPGQDVTTYPLDGTYKGWFKLKNIKGGKSRYEDILDMHFTVNEVEDGGMVYDVKGAGKNQFGQYQVYGTFNKNDKKLNIYRPYIPKTPRAKTPKGPRTPKPVVPYTALDERPGSGRERKQSAVMTEYQKMAAAQAMKKPAPPKSDIATLSVVQREKRLTPALIKCAQILDDLDKQPASYFFKAPVDWVTLNILDYPTIIKFPMDMGTVRTNLTNLFYISPDSFAEHMRLVFRNAIEYNTSRDHPVHIAARELAAKFEQRFQALTTSLLSSIPVHTLDTARTNVSKPKAKRSSAGKGVGGGRALQRQTSFSNAPPPAVDGGSEVVLQMQKQMELMQQELQSLRQESMVRTADNILYDKRDHAQHPLTVEEKKQLVQKVHKLTDKRMAQALEIIKHAVGKADDNSDEIQVSLDDLDTYTLRKLQEFVNNTGPRASLGGGAGEQKKRKSISKPKAPKGESPMQSSKKSRVDTDIFIAPGPGPNANQMYGSHIGPALDVSPYNPAEYAKQPKSYPPPDDQISTPRRQRSDSIEAADLIGGMSEFLGSDDDDDDDVPLPASENAPVMPGWSVPQASGFDTVPLQRQDTGWGEALNIKSMTSVAEAEQRAAEDRIAQQRARQEAERMAALQLRIASQQAEQDAAKEAEEFRAQKEIRLVEKRREFERQQREKLGLVQQQQLNEFGGL